MCLLLCEKELFIRITIKYGREKMDIKCEHNKSARDRESNKYVRQVHSYMNDMKRDYFCFHTGVLIFTNKNVESINRDNKKRSPSNLSGGAKKSSWARDLADLNALEVINVQREERVSGGGGGGAERGGGECRAEKVRPLEDPTHIRSGGAEEQCLFFCSFLVIALDGLFIAFTRLRFRFVNRRFAETLASRGVNIRDAADDGADCAQCRGGGGASTVGGAEG